MSRFHVYGPRGFVSEHCSELAAVRSADRLAARHGDEGVQVVTTGPAALETVYAPGRAV